MEDGRVYGGSNMNIALQNHSLPCSSEVLESLWIPNSSPSFHGNPSSCSTSVVKFEGRPFFPPLEKEENDNEDYDGCSHQPEKKKRLAAEQVKLLERNFEIENRLEPERKGELAKELGLHPRQVAIWFQNRRARFKTKQLEKDYDALKADYDKLEADYEAHLKEKERLRNEVLSLRDKLVIREKESTNLEPSHAINPMGSEQVPTIAASENKSKEQMVLYKQEDASSAKSDVLDSEQSDEDELTRTLLPLPCLPKLEDGYCNDPPSNGCNWNFIVEGQPSWLWP